MHICGLRTIPLTVNGVCVNLRQGLCRYRIQNKYPTATTKRYVAQPSSFFNGLSLWLIVYFLVVVICRTYVSVLLSSFLCLYSLSILSVSSVSSYLLPGAVLSISSSISDNYPPHPLLVVALFSLVASGGYKVLLISTHFRSRLPHN